MSSTIVDFESMVGKTVAAVSALRTACDDARIIRFTDNTVWRIVARSTGSYYEETAELVLKVEDDAEALWLVGAITGEELARRQQQRRILERKNAVAQRRRQLKYLNDSLRKAVKARKSTKQLKVYIKQVKEALDFYAKNPIALSETTK